MNTLELLKLVKENKISLFWVLPLLNTQKSSLENIHKAGSFILKNF